MGRGVGFGVGVGFCVGLGVGVGVVVKSHGGTDAEGFASAVDVAMDMVVHGFTESMRNRLSCMGSLLRQ